MTSLCRDTFDGDESDLDWCVDLNPALCAMTTAELRAAVASGKVGRATRVWRVGLEAWATLPEIPEFVSAFEPEAPSETAATPLAVEIESLPVEGNDTDVRGARSPVVAGARVVPLVPVRARRRAAERAREALFDARWIFAGAAVAAASIGLSLAGTSAPLDVVEARASASGRVASVVVGAAASLERRAPVGDASVSAALAPRAEAGQRRMRGSAHGRADARGRARYEQNAPARFERARRQNP